MHEAHAQQLKDFDELGYIVMPDCFSDAEMAVLRAEAEEIYVTTARRSGARSRARRARRSPPTPTTRRSASSAAIRA